MRMYILNCYYSIFFIHIIHIRVCQGTPGTPRRSAYMCMPCTRLYIVLCARTAKTHMNYTLLRLVYKYVQVIDVEKFKRRRLKDDRNIQNHQVLIRYRQVSDSVCALQSAYIVLTEFYFIFFIIVYVISSMILYRQVSESVI
jgi:hypothetical protein